MFCHDLIKIWIFLLVASPSHLHIFWHLFFNERIRKKTWGVGVNTNLHGKYDKSVNINAIPSA